MGINDFIDVELGDSEISLYPQVYNISVAKKVPNISGINIPTWYTLRNQKVVKNGQWHTFKEGCGVAYAGTWYILKERTPMPSLSVSPIGYFFAYNETVPKLFSVIAPSNDWTVSWKNGAMPGATLQRNKGGFLVGFSVNNSTFVRSAYITVTWGILSVDVLVTQSGL